MKKISRLASVLVLGASLAMPLLAFAQTGINATYIKGYADSIVGIINTILVPVLISIAFIVFLWGVYQYFIQGAANEEAHKTGRMFILYGIIGFVVLFSLWGIVQIFIGTLGLTAGNVPSYPTINSNGVSPTNYSPPGATTNPGTGTVSQQQVSNAFQAYNTCLAQSGSSNCQQQLAAFNRLEAVYQSVGGSSNSSAGGNGTGGGGLGSSCTGDSGCSGDLRCNNLVCSNPSPLNGSCLKDTDCAGSNTTCENDGLGGFCVSSGTSSNYDSYTPTNDEPSYDAPGVNGDTWSNYDSYTPTNDEPSYDNSDVTGGY